MLDIDKADADLLQSHFERKGEIIARKLAAVRRHLAAGDECAAADACPHTRVGLLTGECCRGDPDHGKAGYRCFHCGARISDIGGDVL